MRAPDRTPSARAVALFAVALALITAACGGGAVPSTASPAPSLPPRPAPTVTAVPTTSVKRSLAPPACLGACSPGTHRSARLQPPLTYTVPEGWFIGDDPTEYALRVGSDSATDGIFLFRDPLAHSQKPDCPVAADPKVGTSAKELTDWIARLPGLDATSPKAVTVGGLPGYLLDVRLAPTWTHTCPYSDGQPVVPLIVGSQPGSGPDWSVGSTGMRIWVLDAGENRRIWMDVEAGDRLTLDDMIQRATPVIESFEFSTP